MILRYYQNDCIAKVWEELCDSPNSHPLAVLPTGSGKSLIIAGLIKLALAECPNARITVLAHRKELLQQNRDKILALGVAGMADVEVFSAGLNEKKVGTVTIAGIQSAYSKSNIFRYQNLIIIDEAHLVPSKGYGMYKKFLKELQEYNPALRVVGVTATPFRLDSGLLTAGDDALFTNTVFNIDISKLISDGYLSPLISRRSVNTEIDTNGIKTVAGDFSNKEVVSRVNQVLHKILEEVTVLGKDRKSWILFLPSVEQAETSADMLNSMGISARVVSDKTPKHERDNILKAHRGGFIKALCNVDIATTGYDNPRIDLVVLIRPTKSVGLYIQMVGRGSRMASGKKDCLVLDYGGNIERHGPIDSIEITEKKGKAVAGKAPQKFCKDCGASNFIGELNCKCCGYEFPIQEKPIEEKITKTASNLAILSVPEERIVVAVNFKDHSSEKTKEMVQVKYRCTDIDCYFHFKIEPKFKTIGWGREWWVKNMIGTRFPTSVDDAIDLLNANYSKPEKILTIKKGKYHNFIQEIR